MPSQAKRRLFLRKGKEVVEASVAPIVSRRSKRMRKMSTRAKEYVIILSPDKLSGNRPAES